MNPILEQMLWYGVIIMIAHIAMSLIQRGFFWKFLRVKLSFGKLILVKIRALNRDYFIVGYVDENFLVFKTKDGVVRINIKDKEVFYRVMGTIWIDYDEGTGALSKSDYSVVSGYDPKKYSDLYIRALYKPSLADNKTKFIMGGIMLIIVLIGILAFILYKQGKILEQIPPQIAALKSTITSATVI